jgi:hypothetical protein
MTGEKGSGSLVTASITFPVTTVFCDNELLAKSTRATIAMTVKRVL